MNAFAAATDALFRDRNLSVAARYLPIAGLAQDIRVIKAQPDGVTDFGQGRFVTPTLFLEVRVADVPDPREGDRFLLPDGTTHALVADGAVRDDERGTWELSVGAEE